MRSHGRHAARPHAIRYRLCMQTGTKSARLSNGIRVARGILALRVYSLKRRGTLTAMQRIDLVALHFIHILNHDA